jgi:hypothetical protein
MKIRMAIILLCCLHHFCSLIAQPCNVHAFHATTQQELDDFTFLHGTCEEFNGDIYISGTTIKNLDAISQLKVIHGSLTVLNTEVSSIEFNNLQAIGGQLIIGDNYRLKKIDAFNILDSVGNGIEIVENTILEEVSGFQKLTKTEGTINISYNPSLEKINGFSDLRTVGYSIFIFSNGVLNELQAFSSLDSVGFDIEISRNQSLERIDNFTQLAIVNRNLNFNHNPNLEYIGNFNSLQRIGTEFIIVVNTKLTTIEGFSNLAYLKSLFIDNSDSLSNIGTFSKLHSVDSSLVLLNTGLENLQFLSELKYVKDFVLVVNDRLVNLEGLESLEIVEDLRISQNPILESTKGLTSLTYCGNLIISDNPAFQKVEDLLSINTQELKLVRLEKNPQLSDSQSPFLCKLMAEAPDKLSLYRNGPGCSHTIEIADACQISVGCHAINVHLANLADKDEFLLKNQGCTSLHNLFISSAVNNLEGMESIDSIHGFLELFTSSQADMSFLNNIEWVGGDLRVSGWAASPNFEEFNNLTSVGGDFILNQNSHITSFNGFTQLKTIHGILRLYNNNFETYGEWPALESVGGLEILSNWELKQSTGFSRLKEITGDFIIRGNWELHTLSGFDSLERIGGNFMFRNIDSYTIAPLISLQEIGGDFYISSRFNLKLIGPHPKLSKIGGSFSLLTTDSLVAADFFPQLTNIEGDIRIEATENLQSLSFFRQLTHLGGGLALIDNYGLRTLEAFEHIDTITFLTIDQSRLDSLSGFQNLTHISQDLTLGSIYDLNTFELTELTTIGGNFISQSSIENLSMPKLEEVGADFELRLIHIYNLEGLPSITKIGGKFSIKQGYNLATLSGIPNELIIGGPVILTDNNRLNWCHSTPICNALQDTNRPHEISQNGMGCENLQKVIDECLLLDTEEINTSVSSIRVYPNPANDQIKLMFENMGNYTGHLNATVHDIYGKQTFQSKINSGTENAVINISDLSPGMYILSLKTAEGHNLSSRKIIVQR